MVRVQRVNALNPKTDISVWHTMYWKVTEIFNFNLHHKL